MKDMFSSCASVGIMLVALLFGVLNFVLRLVASITPIVCIVTWLTGHEEIFNKSLVAFGISIILIIIFEVAYVLLGGKTNN